MIRLFEFCMDAAGRVMVRLTARERRWLDDQAGACGLGVTDVVRALIRRCRALDATMGANEAQEVPA